MMRPVKRWRCALIVLCLSMLTACGAKDPVPVVIPLSPCPEPVRPDWPQLDPALYFDGPANTHTLMEQDDAMREYIMGLRRTITCYRVQLPPEALK